MAIHTLESLGANGFRLPDREMVLRALAPSDERCPSCKKHRYPKDFVYLVLPEYAIQECACYHCLPTTETCQLLGAGVCMLASDRYIENMVAKCVPSRWMLAKSPRRDIPVADWLGLGIADVAGKHWGDGCIGKWGRIMSPSGVPFDTHLPCYSIDYKKKVRYFTGRGIICGKCLISSSKPRRETQGNRNLTYQEIKQRVRLICEGARYAVWFASLERYVPDIEAGNPETKSHWGISWIDWLRGQIETTDHWAEGSFDEPKRYRFK